MVTTTFLKLGGLGHIQGQHHGEKLIINACSIQYYTIARKYPPFYAMVNEIICTSAVRMTFAVRTSVHKHSISAVTGSHECIRLICTHSFLPVGTHPLYGHSKIRDECIVPSSRYNGVTEWEWH